MLVPAVLGAVAILSSGAVAQVKDAQSRGVIVLRPTAATPAVAPAAEVATPAAKPTLAAPTLTPAPMVAPKPVAVTAAPPAPVASVGTMPTGPLARACGKPFAQPALSLSQAQFDRKLGKLLAAKPASAVIDLPAPYAVNTDAPAALEPWLSEVKATGGFVSVSEYCQESRGLFTFLRRMFGGGAKDAYKSAAGYDAVLHTNGADQVVTQVEFKRRTS